MSEVIDCSHGPITIENFMRSCFLYGIKPEMAVNMAASMFTHDAMEDYMSKLTAKIGIDAGSVDAIDKEQE